MKHFKRTLVLASCFSLPLVAAEVGQQKALTIWADAPPAQMQETTPLPDPKAGERTKMKTLHAKIWEAEGFPIGNGRMGAMVFGGIAKERIQLNEDTLWSGREHPVANPQAKEGIQEARELIWQGKYGHANEVARTKILAKEGPARSYQTLGDLIIEYPDLFDQNATEYERRLNIETALATTEFTVNGVHYQREVFASAPDQVIVIKLSADQANALNFKLNYKRRYTQINSQPNGLTFNGIAQHHGELFGTKYAGQLTVSETDGQVSSKDGLIEVTDATEAVLLFSVNTDYNHADPHKPLNTDLASASAATIAAAKNKTYTKLKQDHHKHYKHLFGRVKANFAGLESTRLPTETRLKNYSNGQEDLELLTLYFQFARYLMISSSAEGAMPANLQGLWADGYVAPWNSDYHVNINMQMNYWLPQSANLAEMHRPYLDFIERLSIAGQATAKAYGMRGSTVGHTTDAWLMTALSGQPQWGMWVTGGAWATRQMMEYYNYTGDKQRLREQALPTYRRYVSFFLDWLTENPDTGKLVSGPATSPENKFIYIDPESGEEKVTTVSMGPSMDQQIILEAFTYYLEILDILQESDPLRSEVEAALSKLERPQIGPDGRIMEWSENFAEKMKGHRHISHIYGLHPSDLFTYRNNPEMVDAARQTVDYRLANGGGHTGWSRAWIINLWARFKEPEKVRENLQALFAKSTLKNLFDSHPPFQIDGNFGASAGIIESLMQSHDGGIEVLPAWPKEWMQTPGFIEGIRARKGFELDIAWNDGELINVKIESIAGNPCQIILNEHLPKVKVTNLTLGETVTFTKTNDLVTFSTDPGHVYKIEKI
ncbi:glycosyl hydrolase family 95 catalytic domain-containing protein [Gayadomonas joobiniege]|uniref:glycoside hydrolase family 95 protein n=1 Tax=Gayadomonas joobiniege TaxID=1234606 RepID=UPI0003778889|nr:glycoside hydrolase family 95 protein [Gayadomonas joobiniege]